MLGIWGLGFEQTQATAEPMAVLHQRPSVANEEHLCSPDSFDVAIVLSKSSCCFYINMYINIHWGVCVHVHLHIQFSSESWYILAFGDLSQQQAPQVS